MNANVLSSADNIMPCYKLSPGRKSKYRVRRKQESCEREKGPAALCESVDEGLRLYRADPRHVTFKMTTPESFISIHHG